MNLFEINKKDTKLFFYQDGNFGGEKLFHRLTYNGDQFIWLNASDKRPTSPSVQELLEIEYQKQQKEFDDVLEDYKDVANINGSTPAETWAIKVVVSTEEQKAELQAYGDNLPNKWEDINAEFDGPIPNPIEFEVHTVNFSSTKKEHIDNIKKLYDSWQTKSENQ